MWIDNKFIKNGVVVASKGPLDDIGDIAQFDEDGRFTGWVKPGNPVIGMDEFISRFSPDEFDVLKKLRDANTPTGRAFSQEWFRLENKGDVDLSSPRWAAMGPMLISSGVVADQARLDEVLAF